MRCLEVVDPEGPIRPEDDHFKNGVVLVREEENGDELKWSEPQEASTGYEVTWNPGGAMRLGIEGVIYVIPEGMMVIAESKLKQAECFSGASVSLKVYYTENESVSSAPSKSKSWIE